MPKKPTDSAPIPPDCADASAEPLIRVLPEVVQNKIAAGEVVERPASVVKELVENALDAEARSIRVEIEEGGLRLIRVSDDGRGMSRENLAVCIERHATSKIRDVDDIFHIRTMGFRGEALPSIGAVSRLTISTGRPGEPAGHQLRLTGGAREEILPAPPRRGTVVEARDLFFNTPARRKFMKGAAAEVAAINETVTRLALANPAIGFRVESGGRTQLELPAGSDLAQRIAALFGRNLRLIPVDRACGDNGELHVRGFCARPPESRANSRFIYTFLNQRWIRHPGLAHAISDAYQGSLPPRRYPFAVLMFEIAPEQVDVNAHPTKEIVRFENEGLITGGAHKAIREALRGGSFTEEVEHARTSLAQQLAQRTAAATADFLRRPTGLADPKFPKQSRNASAAQPFSHAQPPAALPPARPPVSPAFHPADDSSSAAEAPLHSPYATGRSGTQERSADAEPLAAPLSSATQPAPTGQGQSGKQPHATTVLAPAEAQGALLDQGATLRFLGQAGGRYLVAEEPGGVRLIDQHALHERWNYDRLREADRPVCSQRLLLPLRLALAPAERATAEAALEPLRAAGFEAALVSADGDGGGDDVLQIDAHPELVPPQRVEETVRDVLADLSHAPLEQFRERLLASLACHSAVLFGSRLSPESSLAILEKYHDGCLLTCPHGRPTSLFFSWDELAARFGR